MAGILHWSLIVHWFSLDILLLLFLSTPLFSFPWELFSFQPLFLKIIVLNIIMGPRGIDLLYTIFYFWDRTTNGKRGGQLPSKATWLGLSFTARSRKTNDPSCFNSGALVWSFFTSQKIETEIIDLSS